MPFPCLRQLTRSPRLVTIPVITASAVITILLTSCSSVPDELQIWRQVPIQMARVTQTDSYRQTFLIDTDALKIDEKLTEKEKQDKRMDQVFNALIGDKNWQNLKNLYGVNDIRDEVIDGEVRMEGTVNFTAYLDPLDHDYVILEGSGRFFALRAREQTILLSGDYHIAPQRYQIGEFGSSCIPMDISIYTTRIPGKVTFYHGATVRYNLNIKSYRKNVFSLDYKKAHMGYLDINNDNEYQPDELMASLKMDETYHHVKLIDLSGLEFVKNKYQDKAKGKSRIELEIAELEMEAEKSKQKNRQCVAR